MSNRSLCTLFAICAVVGFALTSPDTCEAQATYYQQPAPTVVAASPVVVQPAVVTTYRPLLSNWPRALWPPAWFRPAVRVVDSTQPSATVVAASPVIAQPTVVTAYRPLLPRWPRALWPPAWFRPTERVAYMPVAGSTACASPCRTSCCKPATACTVRYVPQTSYRNQVYSVPVTTYRPVTTCDPYTGLKTTCMKPCTTHVQQYRKVAYTTYRPVYRCNTVLQCTTNVGCSPCAVGACATCPTDAGAATQHSGTPTPKPTLTPQESLKPEAAEDNDDSGENSEAKYLPMRKLDAEPQLKSENEKTAALPQTTVQRTSHASGMPVRKLDDSGWYPSR